MLVLVLAFLSLMAGGEKSGGGFFDFSGLATAFGIGIAVVGTLLFALYLLLVYTYSRGWRTFLVTISVLAGILLIGTASGLIKSKVAQNKNLDFSSAIVLQPGTRHMELDHSQSQARETKYKFLPQRDGELTIQLTPVGWDDQIRAISVYDSRKKKMIRRNGNVPSHVKISDAVSGQWVYVTVQTRSAYDVYRITIDQ
ncbi:hypothetical protein [Paenibacillus forsythiae]|nr:hypothetical protein [Paenibacillus forsythiae]